MTDFPTAPPPPRGAFGLRHMMFAIFLIAIVLVVLINYWRLVVFFLLSFAPVGIFIGVLIALSRQKAAQQLALLRVMAIAASRRMPIAPGVAAFADLCSLGYQQKAMAFAYLLESGVPLPQALASVPGLLPSNAIVLVCVGWNDGVLATALEEAVSSTEASRNYRHAFLPKLGYLAAVFLFVQSAVGFILYFITPKFEAIFMDFGIQLPEVTIFTIQASHWLIRSWFLLLLIPLELAALVYVPFSYFGWVRWDVPGVDRLLRRRDTAAVLRSLAISVDGGRPISSGIDLLSRFYPRAWARQRLAWSHRAIQAGVSWVDALRRSGLIRRTDAAVLESAQRAGNLEWALRMMADANERRLGYRLQTLSQALFPIVVILAGAVVGFVFVAYFSPLITLIERLAQ